MDGWNPFPHTGSYSWNALSVASAWDRLHRGDKEPLPHELGALNSWAHFHNGELESAFKEGMRHGTSGAHAAIKALCIQARYLERDGKRQQAMFKEAARLAEEQIQKHPTHANAHFFFAYALGRYSHSVSVVKALAQGHGARISGALQEALRLCPDHVDARVALATYHSDVIDKVGPMVAQMSYGAKKATGLQLFEEALGLWPDSPIALIHYGASLVRMEGDSKRPEARLIYERTLALEPLDALEKLEIELARRLLGELR
jgi:tetratricopeptide (TPR) repeat protein